MSLTFYTNPNSRGRIVRWMLEEIGQPYETVVIDYQKTSAFDAWGGATLERPVSNDPNDERVRFFTHVNPIGKVPAIVHDGRAVAESGAIITYLAETFPEAGLAPTPEERADYYRWMFFAAGPIEQAVTNHRAQFVPAPEQEFFFGYGSYERTLDELERAVQVHPFIAGDRFTAADIYVGSHIGWGLGLQTLEPRQAFLDYVGKLVNRDAFKRGVAKDEALLQRADANNGTS
ncbi:MULTISPECIES: glutathione S-transferase family protein [unclassified Mesorhizobium]|uniref:glutathione S-transferase family protein n=2 Tax=Mesorhizobium TaxID=68287 RepID=UPI000FCAFCC4|nr:MULTISPECIES: glutathione S-transferase family protein [unclassified Mesorhizobium]TIT77559.1 MAG: glutathione S-transferase family protein [Mesorhizobium sp.]TGP27064.1 glutathione S-transferase family protein [Mesorhizobium sp. M1D.F.Ca.ET.231.01.1.1]TGP39023.1 glutathione S-transferase family protein [Mesorhizobium sp. M1D.F.Ca.ET.234.01.1.1]TGS51230.1 glutathione S-transferase family protein [Mesorhizobium sp. M1D.F.Ca.ET.184.01.1.1]TGS67114.1 glutathione S-transferase family protein [M